MTAADVKLVKFKKRKKPNWTETFAMFTPLVFDKSLPDKNTPFVFPF